MDWQSGSAALAAAACHHFTTCMHLLQVLCGASATMEPCPQRAALTPACMACPMASQTPTGSSGNCTRGSSSCCGSSGLLTRRNCWPPFQVRVCCLRNPACCPWLPSQEKPLAHHLRGEWSASAPLLTALASAQTPTPGAAAGPPPEVSVIGLSSPACCPRLPHCWSPSQVRQTCLGLDCPLWLAQQLFFVTGPCLRGLPAHTFRCTPQACCSQLGAFLSVCRPQWPMVAAAVHRWGRS